MKFKGNLKFSKPLEDRHYQYLKAFSSTLRVARDPESVIEDDDAIRANVGLPLGNECEFYTGAFTKSGKIYKISNYSVYPSNQPSSWCYWTPSEDKCSLQALEKKYGFGFQCAESWLRYLVNNFIKPWGYSLNGKVKYHSIIANHEDDGSSIHIKNNEITVIALKAFA